MIHGDLSLETLAVIHAVLELPEPLVWCHRENGFIAGVIEGWIQDGVCAVDHMIVMPGTDRKFHTMMTMARECTAALHARGLDVVIKIARDDERYSSLEAWATRMKYMYYINDGQFDWYISRKEVPANGQGQTPVRSSASASAS